MDESFVKYTASRHRPRILRRALSAVTAITGGLILTAACAAGVRQAAKSFSVTNIAKRCFPYPESSAGDDAEPGEAAGELAEEIARSLLSSAFFGSDALYFDLAGENTGTLELSPKPSPVAGTEAPDDPLDIPSISGAPSGGDIIPEGYNIYAFDSASVLSGEVGLVPYDMSSKKTGMKYSNATKIDMSEVRAPDDYPIKASLPESIQVSSGNMSVTPLVLIVHTHGTEAFAPEGVTSVKRGTSMRSSDISENIVAVGSVMADILNSSGIPTIHCETMHDIDSYRESYSLSADTVRRYLAKYPSIKYVFDVHRDAIVTSGGDYVKAVCEAGGRLSAQVMLLVGTNEKGADHPDWTTNLAVAEEWQRRAEKDSPGLMRPINLRGASFNEQLAPGSLLIEVGSAGNTLSEAKYAAERLTYSLVGMIRDNAE